MSKKEEIETHIKDIFNRVELRYYEFSERITLYGYVDIKMSQLKNLSELLEVDDLTISISKNCDGYLCTDIDW